MCNTCSGPAGAGAPRMIQTRSHLRMKWMLHCYSRRLRRMWSDNETTTDLIGFRVHTDLIRAVVTDSDLLPVVLGVFGDWGGGKSSIMKMLEKDLNSDEHQDTACLYFNGWMFEGYEDAKTALLSSILIELGEHKRFGPMVKDKVTGLLKRVKLMELAK